MVALSRCFVDAGFIAATCLLQPDELVGGLLLVLLRVLPLKLSLTLPFPIGVVFRKVQLSLLFLRPYCFVPVHRQ